MLRDAAASAILDAGVLAATPTVGVLVREHTAAGAVQISASHNPPAYNGIKLFSTAGRVLDGETGAKVRERYLNRDVRWTPSESLGSMSVIDDPNAEHLETELATVEVDAIRK